MKVLYIGGTGEVSPGCIAAGLELGQQITVFNRGTSGTPLPAGVHHIAGDINDDAKFFALGKQHWDAVCQFRTFNLRQHERDVQAFAGNTAQFVFISTAMVYQRPPFPFSVTESAPRSNPHSPHYAQPKMEIEDRLLELHHANKLPTTIVRPSHTTFANFPGTFIPGDHIAWRMLKGKPVIVHGDGSSLWSITRSEDFGRAFAKLLGNPQALGQAFHITTDELRTWDEIFNYIAAALHTKADLIHVPTETLIRYDPTWAQALLGDKTHSIAFDNSKIRHAADNWTAQHTMREAIQLSAPSVQKRMTTFKPDPKLEALLDRIIQDQGALGRQ
jgi:nucleoside-diphosphate-sugar epimerase